MIRIAIALALVAACGSEETTSGPAPSPATSPTPSTPPAAPAPPSPEPSGQAIEPAPPAAPTIPAPAGNPDPRATAIAILNACRGTDGPALRALATRSNADDIPVPEGGQSLCATIFGADSWRNQAVTAWNGQIEAVRINGQEARALFHDMGGGEVAVVAMKLEDSAWKFDDINSPDRSDFDQWGHPAP